MVTDRLEERVKRLEVWSEEMDGWLEEGAKVLLEVAKQHEKVTQKAWLVIASLAFMLGMAAAFALVSTWPGAT